MERPVRRGWKISEVKRLVGLSRRNVQRCCYDGAGGVGLLSPKDGSWGRRTYDERDLATLFLVAKAQVERQSTISELLATQCEFLSTNHKGGRSPMINPSGHPLPSTA